MRDKLIIIVDDEEDVKPLFEYYFQTHIDKGTVLVDYTQCAIGCLNIIEKNQDKAIHVLSDIEMPHMKGTELLKEIRSKRDDILFSFITAYEQSNYSELDYDNFFSKPIDFDALINKVLKDFN